MSATKLVGVVARASNNVIGSRNRLPWPKITEDMQHFARLTAGAIVIMGHNTWRSLPVVNGQKLPGRTCVVLSRNATFKPNHGAVGMRSPEQVMTWCDARGDHTAYVIGGAEIYRAFSKHLRALHVTQIHHEYLGDTYFRFDEPAFTKRVTQSVVTKCGLPVSFEYWDRD